MKTRESRPLREHFEVPTDAGEALRTFDYIEELEAYINHLEALRQPDVIGTLPLSKVDGLLKALEDIKNWDDDLEDEWEDQGYRAIAALKEWTS